LRAAPAGRVVGLDGVRGLAATFVVLHHCWLLSYPGYPSTTGPFWTGWLLYGHFAVVVFIALSGFTRAVSPRATTGNWAAKPGSRTGGRGGSCLLIGPRSSSA
jgi:peptidoglycan/LPS O-acetylase OafA/YrhL